MYDDDSRGIRYRNLCGADVLVSMRKTIVWGILEKSEKAKKVHTRILHGFLHVGVTRMFGYTCLSVHNCVSMGLSGFECV